MDTVLEQTAMSLAFLGISGFNPVLSQSTKWMQWITNRGPATCSYCAEQNNKIYDILYPPPIEPPVHERCKCFWKALLAILAGTATIDGKAGADYWVKCLKCLPTNYLSKQDARERGWKNKLGNLRQVIPRATIGGDFFDNDKGKLPTRPGRIWYEADINYTGGYRNTHRLLYSNDGLTFVTYDHYNTFYEIH